MQIRKMSSLVFGILQIILAYLMIFISVISLFNNLNDVSIIDNAEERTLQLVILSGLGFFLLINGLFLAYEWKRKR